jgi:hypothetical protein
MVEELIQIMVERWGLPEAQVREFIIGMIGNEIQDLNLEGLRTKTTDLLHDMILETGAAAPVHKQ